MSSSLSPSSSRRSLASFANPFPRKNLQWSLPNSLPHSFSPTSYHIAPSHKDGDRIAQQSVHWLDSNCPDLSPKGRVALRGLQAGELTAYCYNTTTPERLRVVSDFMNYLFHLYVTSPFQLCTELTHLSGITSAMA
jgi:hypothetical protein